MAMVALGHPPIAHIFKGERMRVSRGALVALGMAVIAQWSPAGAITVTVNQNTRYQAIEGIGPMEGGSSWKYKQGAFYLDVNLDALHYFDTLIDDGGFTALRSDPLTEFQPTAGDFRLTGNVRKLLLNQQKYLRAARQRGEPFRILWSCWSPPPWMKANNSCCDNINGDLNNYLLPARYPDFANHVIKLLQLAKDTFDIDVYAVSLQNEPLFNEPYASCNYGYGPGCGWNGVCYNNMFKVVAPLIHSAFPNVKLVASEDLNRTTVETALRNDPVSNPLVYAWATHNDFTDNFAYWKDRPIWQTEPHPEGFMSDAQMCMSNIGAGASMWFDWGYSNGFCGTAGTADISCLKRGTYNSLKMFARYVRPGAVLVASGGGSGGSYGVQAFYHPTDTCLTIILINGTGASAPATLSITGPYQPSSFRIFSVTESTDEIEGATVAANGTYTMPANSVTALVAGKYRSTSVSARPVAQPSVRSNRVAPVRGYTVHSLDGRVVSSSTGSLKSTSVSTGVYLTRQLGDNSRSLVVAPR